MRDGNHVNVVNRASTNGPRRRTLLGLGTAAGAAAVLSPSTAPRWAPRTR